MSALLCPLYIIDKVWPRQALAPQSMLRQFSISYQAIIIIMIIFTFLAHRILLSTVFSVGQIYLLKMLSLLFIIYYY